MSSPQLAQVGFLDLILQAGLVAKLVLVILLFASMVSWAIIFMKWRTLRLAVRDNDEFLKGFWQSKSIDDIFAKVDDFSRSPVANVFKSGVKELKKFSPNELTVADEQSIENVSRALARASHTEIAVLEKSVSWLATTASAAPFIGLFGTVWGIMNSFQSIGATGAASLAVVAPGISEALVTTATGIAAAIPAVIAYNHFAGQIKRQAIDIECFAQDFLNIIQRSMIGRRRGV